MNHEMKKTRFNIIDAVIILIILAIIGAAAYLVITDMQSKNYSRLTGNMDFTVRISDVDESTLALFERGTVVKDSVTGEVIGELVGYNAEKARYFGKIAVPNATGDGYTVPVSKHEDKYDVYIIIRATAEKDLRGIHYVQGTKILIGSTVYFKIPSFTSISYITDFTPMITE